VHFVINGPKLVTLLPVGSCGTIFHLGYRTSATDNSNVKYSNSDNFRRLLNQVDLSWLV